MRLRSRLAVSLGGFASAILLFAGTALAAGVPNVTLSGDHEIGCAAPVGVSCFMPGPGNSLTANYTGPRMRTVHKVCLTFTFYGDLIDAGDALNVQVVPGAQEPGFEQAWFVTTVHTLCMDSAYTPELTAAFADGRQCMVVYMVTGSSYIRKVTATVS